MSTTQTRQSTVSSARLAGKIALVTGGSSGIGLATAERFVAEGAYVFITGRRSSELEGAVEKIGRNVAAVAGDVASLADLDRLFATIKSEKGSLDVVFANAGIGTFLPLGSITEEQYHQTFDTNVKGVIFTVQKALPLLRDGSSIILNASIINSRAMPAFSVYAATKSAIRNLARGWTLDLKARGIRVNAISPGLVPTPGYKQYGMTQEQLEGLAKHMSTQIPAGRPGQVEEIAAAVAFLASDDSSYVAAAELVVDGGFSNV